MEVNINPTLIHNFIEKARIANETKLVKEEYAYLDSNPANLHYQEAASFVNQLDPEQQITLVALMYIGRGDYDPSEWPEVLEVAKNYWTNHTGEYLLSRPLVTDYLEEGLEQITQLNN